MLDKPVSFLSMNLHKMAVDIQYFSVWISYLLLIAQMLVVFMLLPWFQISADSDTYRRYRIWFWGARYDINPIISADIGSILPIWPIFLILTSDMDDYAHWKPLADTDTGYDSEILHHGSYILKWMVSYCSMFILLRCIWFAEFFWSNLLFVLFRFI